MHGTWWGCNHLHGGVSVSLDGSWGLGLTLVPWWRLGALGLEFGFRVEGGRACSWRGAHVLFTHVVDSSYACVSGPSWVSWRNCLRAELANGGVHMSLDSCAFDCASGPNSLMAGSLARMLWLVPFTAIYLPAYEQSKRLLLNLGTPPPPLQRERKRVRWRL